MSGVFLVLGTENGEAVCVPSKTNAACQALSLDPECLAVLCILLLR